MDGGALVVAQLFKLLCLRHHKCVGGDLAFVRRNESGDLWDQSRYVIQQRLTWEDILRKRGNERRQALKPSRRERVTFKVNAPSYSDLKSFIGPRRHWEPFSYV